MTTAVGAHPHQRCWNPSSTPAEADLEGEAVTEGSRELVERVTGDSKPATPHCHAIPTCCHVLCALFCSAAGSWVPRKDEGAEHQAMQASQPPSHQLLMNLPVRTAQLKSLLVAHLHHFAYRTPGDGRNPPYQLGKKQFRAWAVHEEETLLARALSGPVGQCCLRTWPAAPGTTHER